MHFRILWLTAFSTVCLLGQSSPLHLKTRTITPDFAAPQSVIAPPEEGVKLHRIVQFQGPVTQDTVDQLSALGIQVVGAVPENGLVVLMEGTRMRAAMAQLADV